ncbi:MULTISPECIES: hypothetical protein [unclassified Rhodococcus (in: high G+C Gram-positive bacteria)]|uniref:hypothetical protein n=1 Tax=Rhodococcus sp. SJ-3 TaxID=3454628 RepID=UPI002D92463D|nr:hypothetical protein [Rhodococcus sp. (in: high G+C Gram-positive bacteria)]
MTLQVPSPPRPRQARSTAAQRAYQRRNQRAAQLVSPAETRGRTTGARRVATRIPFVASIIALLAVGMMVTLLLTTRAAEDSYELGAARAYNESLLQQRAVLQRDVEAGLTAPVLAQHAAELGMIPAGQATRLVVGEDGSVQVVGEPVAAQGAPPAPLNAPEPRGDVQPPLAGSAGRENPRPLSPSGEQPAPRDAVESPEAVDPESRAAAAAEAPRASVPAAQTPVGEPAPGAPAGPGPEAAAGAGGREGGAAPQPENVTVLPEEAEQSVPVSELPQPEASRIGEPLGSEAGQR